jgi:hypothetical protein
VSDEVIIEWMDKALMIPRIYISKELQFYSFKWIVLTGKFYMIWNDSRECNSFKVYIKGENEGLDNALKPTFYMRRPKIIFSGVLDQSLVEISKLISCPVFMIESIQKINNRSDKVIIKIDSKIPVLGDYGFSKILSPFDVFHDISYFLGNVVHPSPDMAPPVFIDDKYRIQQHGFDLKTSFRGK